MGNSINAIICICVHVNRLLRIWNLLSKARTRAIRQLNFGHSRCILWQYISSMWVIFTRLLFLQQCFHSWKFDFIDLSAPSFALSPDTLWYFGMAIMRNITQSCSNEKTPLFFLPCCQFLEIQKKSTKPFVQTFQKNYAQNKKWEKNNTVTNRSSTPNASKPHRPTQKHKRLDMPWKFNS